MLHIQNQQTIHLRWNNKVSYVKGRLLNVTSTVLSVVTIATVVVPRPLELCRDCALYCAGLLVALLPSNAISVWVCMCVHIICAYNYIYYVKIGEGGGGGTRFTI